jgi:dihydroneopterin aldolase
MSDRIRVQGIEFYGFHGWSDAEREVGHRYLVDLEIETDLSAAGKSDSLESTIDYARAIRIVQEIGAGSPVHLMEALADRIAESLLTAFAAADSVRVAVSKRLPPVKGIVASAGVEIMRRRAK